jgi:hypothetical protein
MMKTADPCGGRHLNREQACVRPAEGSERPCPVSRACDCHDDEPRLREEGGAGDLIQRNDTVKKLSATAGNGRWSGS